MGDEKGEALEKVEEMGREKGEDEKTQPQERMKEQGDGKGRKRQHSIMKRGELSFELPHLLSQRQART